MCKLNVVRLLINAVMNDPSDAVRMAALRGHGLAQLPSYMLREDLAAGRLVRILEEFTPAPTPLHAIYAHRELSATVRLFIAYLEHHFHAQDARLHER